MVDRTRAFAGAAIERTFRWPHPTRAIPAACALCAAVTLGAGSSHSTTLHSRSSTPLALLPVVAPTCPPSSLPDGEGNGVACVQPRSGAESPEAPSSSNAHHDKKGRYVVYDQIPRRPERAQDYDAYLYPVPCERNCVVSGYDLDRPDELQRRGRKLSHVGHGAVDLVQKRGTLVSMISLEHQVGDAQVVYAGPLFGTTVVTRQTLREGGRLREYIVLFGHLDAAAPGLNIGTHLKDGDPVGFVGDTGSPELVHLHLETRRLRDGVDPLKLSPWAMIDDQNSVVCDPRNVLPTRQRP